MQVTVRPGARIGGAARAPGDKSISHRWVMLAATASGGSEIDGLPSALDVRSTSRVFAALTRSSCGPQLEAWASKPAAADEEHGSTTNGSHPRARSLRVEARGRRALEAPVDGLDCGNSGTTMRLTAGVVSGAPITVTLSGDASLSSRPMERVAAPLRAMGARVETTDGHAPLMVAGGDLSAIHLATEVPSAQVKGAVLLAGCAAEGRTVVEEAAGTRDHTERALAALGAPVEVADGRVSVEAFQHEGFSARVPGDISAAAFVLAAAALGGGSVEIPDVGLNPSRTRLLDVLRRMGLLLQVEVEGEALGEPIGTVRLETPSRLGGTTVTADELPLLIDEVPALAMVAAFAAGETRFLGAGELRVKESDRLAAIASTIRSLGGEAAVEDDDLVLGGGGLEGGTARSYGDHRIAMAAFVAGVGARGPVVVRGIEAAEVSFPSFVRTMVALGAEVDG